MKEYKIAHNDNAEVLTDALNHVAKQGWVPTHFAMSSDNDTDTFGVLLERESRVPTPKRGDS